MECFLIIFKIIILSSSIIYIRFIFNFLKNNYKFFCNNCANRKKICSECYNCPADILFESIKFRNREETLKELLENKKSIARFGDGEFKIIFKRNIHFQKYNKTLQHKLLKVLNSEFPGLLIGIFPLCNNTNKYWLNFIDKYKFKIAKIINKNKVYYHSGITRFFHQMQNRTQILEYVTKFKKIWNNRNILIVEGEKTRLGIGNDLFDNSKSIQRIICPAEQAFNAYKKIIKFIKKFKIKKNTIILISLGPTATILTYEIFKLGVQVIDFGHFDIEYEFYLRNAKKVIKIENKYVNEIPEGRTNITPITDEKYYKQIITTIY